MRKTRNTYPSQSVSTSTSDDPELNILQGAYHELSNEFDEVKEQLFNEVVAFVDSTIAAPAAKL